MKMREAEDIIAGKHLRSGYCVAFEVRVNGVLTPDHFPDVHAGETGIASEGEAWALAKNFANALLPGGATAVNVHVVRASDFVQVTGVFNSYLGGPKR
jgi:hypothetical protein